MSLVFKILSMMLIPIIVRGVFAFLRQGGNKTEKGKVHLPKFFVIFGSVASAVFLIPTFITLFSDEPLWVSVVFFLFSLIGATLVIAFMNCRISYDENGFTAKNFFGFKRRYTYNQITGIKFNMHETYIYVGKKRVMVDEFSLGGREFISFAKKKYRALNDGRAIPELRKDKGDIFNGNVEDVGGFIFAYISVAVLALGMLAFVVVNTWFMPATQENTVKHQVVFSSFTVEEDDLIIKSNDNKVYKLFNVSNEEITEKIKALCDGETEIEVYSKEQSGKKSGDYYSIKAIFADGSYILSFDEINRMHRDESLILVIIAVGFNVVWIAFVFFSIKIGRNPQKYSKRVIRLFFKDGYVHY